MPSAMSRPSEPVETVSTSIDLLFLPSRMIEPLPNERSIWESAASRAFDLSMEELSTRRSAVVIAPLLYMTGIGMADKPPARQDDSMYTVCSWFASCSHAGQAAGRFPEPSGLGHSQCRWAGSRRARFGFR